FERGHSEKITAPLKYRDNPEYNRYSVVLSASGGLFFKHNPREIGYAFHRAGTETCPPPADWAKRPFIDGH
ncbi:MAG: hypothetical protein WBG61_13440, partial [Desulfobacterales bacterium]